MTQARPKALDSRWAPTAITLFSKTNAWLYKKTNGRIGGTWRGGSALRSGKPICLLTTIGRKSGQPRTAPLVYLRDGERVIVGASHSGMAKPPQWYLNLRENPDVTVQIGSETRSMRARTASPGERSTYWEKLVAFHRDFEVYQSWTSREIPVVILEPLT